MEVQEKVTLEQVRHIATLANLHLTDIEEGQMQTNLNSILTYMESLHELNTEGVEPLAQIGESLKRTDDSAWLREDTRRASIDRELVMHQAPESDGRFFKVPKVIER